MMTGAILNGDYDMRSWILAFPLFLLLAAGVSAQTITSVTPDSAAVNDPVKIEGTGFGKTAGTVTVGGKEAKSPIWGDTSIIIAVPPDAKSGNIVVTVPGGGSPSHAFVVKSPGYDHFELLTGVGAVLAGVEATSYKTDNDAL